MKPAAGLVLLTLFLGSSGWTRSPRQVPTTGTVLAADPIFHKITISHGLIKGLSDAGDTDFSADLSDIRGLKRGDTVSFIAEDEGGSLSAVSLRKTGDKRLASKDKVEIVEAGVKGALDRIDDQAGSGSGSGLIAGTVSAATHTTGSLVDGAGSLYEKEKNLTHHSW